MDASCQAAEDAANRETVWRNDVEERMAEYAAIKTAAPALSFNPKEDRHSRFVNVLYRKRHMTNAMDQPPTLGET